MSEAAATSCPKCGAAIPPEAPQGLCPKCLLQQASFPTETGHTTRHTRPAPPDRDELARAFPHLQILELIGQGGMGFVYKARQPKLDRLVALKILARPLAEQTHFAERFTREGRTLAKLNHPNIVTIHDFGQAGPFFYLLMEYVDGVNLRQAMRAGAVNSTQALAIVPRICEALQYAHNEGVLHRDIKPDNILLDMRGRVKIADFGIAKLLAEAVAENPLTGSGASLGTPHYMAPEQIEKPNAVDHRADIYSLGVVFYEMLTGELPLGRFSAPSETTGIDPRLDEIVFQTLEKQPERRPQSADEVKTRVETISAGPQSENPSENQVTFKMSLCYLTTPQFLRTYMGRLLRFTNKGELRLNEETLTFAPRHQNWIVIPLRAVTSLSMGDFRAGIGKLKFISVTFTEKGNVHRVFLIPTRGALRSIWNTNELVEEWFNAIRHAAKARTGRVPPSLKDDLHPLPSTSTSKASLSSAFLKGALTLALFVILGLGVGLGAFIGLYALLRKPTPRQAEIAATPNPIVFTSNTTANAGAPTGPIKTLHLAFDYFGPSPEHNINLKGLVDLANDEIITTAIRYNDADWSFVRFSSSWDTEEKLARLHWPVPENFSIPFDLEPVVTAFFHHAPAIPIQLSTNGPLTLFTVTNALHQRITLGIAYRVAPATNATPKLSNLVSRKTVNGFDMPGVALLPPGMTLEAWYTYAGGFPTTVRITRDMPGGITIAWKPPADFPANDALGLQTMGRLFSPPFAPRFTNNLVDLSADAPEVFAITNSGDKTKVWRGFLKLRRVDRFEQTSNSVREHGKEPEDQRTLDVIAVAVTNFHSIALRTTTESSIGETFVPLVRYGNGPWAESDLATKRLSWSADKSGQHHLGIYNWNVPSGFNSEYQMSAAASTARFRAEQGPIAISNEPTVVFAITNETGQTFSGGLRVASISLTNKNATATFKDFAAFSRSEWPGGFVAGGTWNVPTGHRLQAVGYEGTTPVETKVSNDKALTDWSFPQFEWSWPAQFPNWDFRWIKYSRENLQIKAGEPYTVFAFTNQDGVVYRAQLALIQDGVFRPK